MSTVLERPVLVLNRYWQPVHTCTVRRSLHLLCTGGALVVQTDGEERFGTHDYADNALFWIGQVQFDEARFGAALATFHRVITEHPTGNKVPDALLMIGLTQAKLGRGAEGRETLARLRAMYPQTEAARKADDRLQPGKM